jgi:hypothetical protein
MSVRAWFGPSRSEVWKQLSAEIGGEYVDGGFWRGDKVEVTHGEWTITLDTYTVSTGKVTIVYTRMRAPYVNTEDFRFTVSRAGFLTEVAKKLGMQDIDIGHEPFDHDFVVKSNDEPRVRALFANATIRELLLDQPNLHHFSVRGGDRWMEPRLPDDQDALEFLVMGVVKDIPRLKALYELLSETLEELCRVGAAYRRAPAANA